MRFKDKKRLKGTCSHHSGGMGRGRREREGLSMKDLDEGTRINLQQHI